MLRTVLTLSALAGLLANSVATTASADIVTLKNGRKLEGKVERTDGKVLLRTVYGTATLSAAEVQSVQEQPTLIDEHAKQAANVSTTDAAGQMALAQWCLEHEWKQQAQVHATHVVAVEPHNVQARTILDHTLLDGRWMPRADALRAQGLVQYRGKWMTLTQAEAQHAADLEQNQRVRTQALVNHIVRTMSRADAAGRRLCYDELCHIATQTDTPGLAESAKQVYDHYEKVAAMSTSVGSGVVMTELRLTNAQLVRPIPQLQTNLGQANSTPVTIQLPELQIQGIQTTVAIPFGLPK